MFYSHFELQCNGQKLKHVDHDIHGDIHILNFNAVVKKLKHVDHDIHGDIVSPYQKSQAWINYLLDLFSIEND